MFNQPRLSQLKIVKRGIHGTISVNSALTAVSLLP